MKILKHKLEMIKIYSDEMIKTYKLNHEIKDENIKGRNKHIKGNKI